MKSEVFFIELKTSNLGERISALEILLSNVSPFKNYKENELLPVKITLGDSTCVYHVAPELVKTIVTEIKKKKAKPFLFDTNVIYKGSRQNAVDHMTLAQNKGFGYTKVGAPFIVADGVLGRDGIDLHTNGEFIKKVKTPSFVGMTDSLVVITHATGHILSGYAGAIKNVAMGMSCKGTKQVMHSSIKPNIMANKCTACGQCIKICPASAISMVNGKAFINQERCIGCGECLCACNFNAIKLNWGEDHDVFCKRMAETATAILAKFKNKFFINFLFDITIECDCISTKSDKIITENIGILASNDPVAIDKATVDLCNSKLDVFKENKLSLSYNTMINHAAKIGLGNIGYDLVKI